MSNVEDEMAHLSIRGGEDDGVRIELDAGDSPLSFNLCFQSSPVSPGQNEIIRFPQVAPFVSRRNYISQSLSGKEVLGGAHIVSSGPLLGSKTLGPCEGYDTVMGSSEEDLPLANVESSKRPRIQSEDLGVSLVKDSSSDDLSLSVGPLHGVSRTQ
ncbi:hypothetical protein V6N13_074152 [Hibiscus sabdariffa]